jgi:hypothetical protein
LRQQGPQAAGLRLAELTTLKNVLNVAPAGLSFVANHSEVAFPSMPIHLEQNAHWENVDRLAMLIVAVWDETPAGFATCPPKAAPAQAAYPAHFRGDCKCSGAVESGRMRHRLPSFSCHNPRVLTLGLSLADTLPSRGLFLAVPVRLLRDRRGRFDAESMSPYSMPSQL